MEYLYERHEIVSQHLQKPLSYGTLRSPSSPVQETFCFFHAGNGDDQQFMEMQLGSLLSPATWKKIEDRGIQFLFPFIGTSFLAHSWERAFLEEILPRAEPHPVRARFAHGFSMGGQVALSLLFRKPGLLQGAAAHFATLIDFNPMDPVHARSFQERMGVSDASMQILISGFQNAFKSHEDFLHQDPLALARGESLENLRGKKIYFDVGGADDFGLQEGARALHAALADVPHRFEEAPGLKHDASIILKNFDSAVNHLIG